MDGQAKSIRWGIIGLGRIAHKFAQDLRTVEGCELYAVASRSQDKADAFASEFKASKVYNSYEALVNDTQVDAVYIATPHVFHKENTIMCLKHGIAVLCEKPFAMSLEEVTEMTNIAQEQDVLLMEALWTYFLPHYQFVLKTLESKTYGAILKVEADFGFHREFDDTSRLFKKSLGGGSLLDIGIYPIFAALSMLGKPKQIEAQATFYENGVDSSCDMVFHYDNQVKAKLESTLLKQSPTEAVIYCETGTITLHSRFHEPTTITLSTNHSQEIKAFECDTFGYNYEIAHFNQLLRDGKTESDIMTFDFSKLLIHTLDAVRKQIGLTYN
ncbi:Gfo/Idh/MocA family protein [Flavobacteriaceae bacterium LMO-SS05]